jgi:hypothetical protein
MSERSKPWRLGCHAPGTLDSRRGELMIKSVVVLGRVGPSPPGSLRSGIGDLSTVILKCKQRSGVKLEAPIPFFNFKRVS